MVDEKRGRPTGAKTDGKHAKSRVASTDESVDEEDATQVDDVPGMPDIPDLPPMPPGAATSGARPLDRLPAGTLSAADTPTNVLKVPMSLVVPDEVTGERRTPTVQLPKAVLRLDEPPAIPAVPPRAATPKNPVVQPPMIPPTPAADVAAPRRPIPTDDDNAVTSVRGMPVYQPRSWLHKHWMLVTIALVCAALVVILSILP